MKKLLLLLALSFVISPVLSTPAMTVVQKNMGYISINASESMELSPNTATINFSVETTDIDSKRASEMNNQITTKVITALKNELASDKKSYVQTRNFNLRPNYKTNTDTEVRVIKNYTATNTIQVKTSDITKVSSLIDTAIKNNVSNVNNVSMTVEEYDVYSNELVNKALLKARTTANSTAAALNQKVTGIKNVRVNVYQQGSNGIRLYKTAAAGVESAADTSYSTPVESGKIKLNASVDAEFYVK